MNKLVAVFVITVATLCFQLLHTPVNAQSSTTGIDISPAQVQLEVAESQQTQEKKITITNKYAIPVRMTADLRDTDENSGALTPKDTLDSIVAGALKVSDTDFVIEANSKKTITVTGTNTDMLGPGGHYLSLLLTVTSTRGETLAVQSAVSVNIFFIKADGARVSVRLDRLSTSNWLFHITSKADVDLTNDGNVRTVPYGAVTVTNSKDELISKGYINPGSLPLMPGKSTAKTIQLTRIQRVWYPQKLTLAVSYRADTYDSSLKTFDFWYIPPFFVVVPLILLLTGLALLFRRKRRMRKPTKNPQNKNDMPQIMRVAISLTQLGSSEKIHVRKGSSKTTSHSSNDSLKE
jgi:hypothetical protein